jgi:carboxyl-terminal processing protease
MLPATNRGVGMHIGFPDVCLTPVGPAVVPIPYPNFALTAQAVPFSPVVKVSGVNALNIASKIPMTFGDDPGTAHPVFKQVGQYVMGNPIVNIDRLPGVNLLCPTTGNAMNNALGAVLVPSAVNVFYTFRNDVAEGPSDAADPYGGELHLDALQALAGEMRQAASTAVVGEALPGGVGYLRLPLFTMELPTLVHNAIRALEEGGARALILDIRNNPGGDLDAFLRLAADFLPRGAVLARLTDADGDEEVIRVTQEGPCALPLIVLVDRGTASAGELFAGCLKAHGRALLVGETTYGKGAAQKVGLAPDGSSAVYKTAVICVLPSGEAIDGAGITPDIEIPRKGAQLRAARLLASKIAEGPSGIDSLSDWDQLLEDMLADAP